MCLDFPNFPGNRLMGSEGRGAVIPKFDDEVK